jgi:hypothetical protein
MHKDVQVIFDQLRQTLIKQELTDADLFDCIAGFASSPNPMIAHALASHARDICQDAEEGSYMEYSVLIAEVYRRTFFDLEAAKLYGTEYIPLSGPENLMGLASHLLQACALEAIEIDPGQFVPGNNTHQ